MGFMTRGFAAIFSFLCLTQVAAAAVSIQYAVTQVSGNVYKYVYSVTNSGPDPVQVFDIYFDTSLYSSFQIVTPAPLSTQWQEAPLVAIPPALQPSYTAKALSGGIPAGATVTGFSVQVTWIGGGRPGAQPFEIYTPGFVLLQSGTTGTAPSTVPAASTISLCLLGLALASATAYQTRLRTSEASRSHSLERV